MAQNKNGQYWSKRFTKLEETLNGYGQDTYRQIEPAFNQVQREIQSKIDSWVVRVANNNQVSLTEAKRMLDAKELAEFRWNVKEYIKYGHDNELDAGWMKELENASARYHISRLEALKIQTQQAMEKAFGNELDELDSMSRKVYSEGYYHTAYELQKGFKVGWDIASIDSRKLERLISKPWAADGKNFSNRIWQSKTSMVNELHNELVRTCMLGKSPDEAIRHMTKFVDKKFKNAKMQAGRLVMTEQAFFASAAQKDAFTDLDVEEFEVVATLDSHTSEICQSMDGQHFPMKDYQPGVTAPPFHVWCRSTTVPYFDDEFNIGERAARGKDGKTYYVPDSMKYPEWKQSFVDGGSKDELKPTEPSTIIEMKNSGKYKSLQECFSSVSIKNIEPAYSNSIEERLLDLQNTYPIEKGQIVVTTSKDSKAFGYNQAQVVVVKSKGQDYAEYRHKLNFSNALMDTKESSISRHERNYKARGSKLVADNLGLTTVDHEYAHAIDNAYAFTKRPDLLEFANKYSTRQSLTWTNVSEINDFNRTISSCKERLCEVIWDKMQVQYGTSDVDFLKLVKNELGSYAIESRAEFLAEGFSNFRNLGDGDKTEFIKSFEKIFNEEYKKVLGD